MLLSALLPGCDDRPAWNGSLADFLHSQPQRFGTVMQDPAAHRVQVIYTQIDRDADNRPTFRSYEFRANPDEYFYPASTVKLPTAVVALEKLARLGVPRDATMLTGAAADFQTPATTDATAPNGLPSVEHYIRKLLVVSDNDAFNRLYEFVGQQGLNEALHARGLDHTRIVHRLEIALDEDENRYTNPVRFVAGDRVLHEQPAEHGQVSYVSVTPELLGVAEVIDGVRHERPKDFATKNSFPLIDQQRLFRALLFPESVEPGQRFNLSAEDYRFLYRWMSTYPAESGIAAYGDRDRYPDGYVKFLMYGGDAKRIRPHIRIFNKVGDAYGFLTDTAYVVDFDQRIEFLLSATVYTNANGTFNDNNYEYDEIGWPFLRELGQAIYEVELARPRAHRPDLSRFYFSERGLPEPPASRGAQLSASEE